MGLRRFRLACWAGHLRSDGSPFDPKIFAEKPQRRDSSLAPHPFVWESRHLQGSPFPGHQVRPAPPPGLRKRPEPTAPLPAVNLLCQAKELLLDSNSHEF